MAKGIILLICYHLLLFRRFYFQNGFIYARSEALEQGFASSLLLGRSLRSGRLVPTDPYYYPDYPSLPFLSSFYPPHMLQAYLGSFFRLDTAWIIYSLTMVLHYLVCSVSVYLLLLTMSMMTIPALFGAITLSSLGYAMKQNSCIVYTCAWIPIVICSAMLHLPMRLGISLGMMLLAGYWPIALYTIPLGCWLWLLG